MALRDDFREDRHRQEPTAATASQNFSTLAADGTGAPDAPTGVSATAGNGFLSVTFLPPANDGGSAITAYTATCTPDTSGPVVTGTSDASPIVVFGVIDGLTYTCTVTASNIAGVGAPSDPSNPVTFAAGEPAPAAAVPAIDRLHEGVLVVLLALIASAGLRRRRADVRRRGGS